MSDAPVEETVSELRLARSTLDAARLLAGAGFHRDAVTRAYYAIFHAASALLASIGRRSRTHEGVRALVNEHFIRTGLLEPEHGRSLRRTAGDRNDADYDAAAVFTPDDSRDDIERASRFVEAVERLVASKGA